LALQAIDQYQVIPKSLADVARTAAPAAAGYRSWTALERTTRHLSIDSDGRTVRAMPYRACPEGGMTGAVHPPPQCGRDAASVGALILGTLRQMPPPPGVKPPRAPKSASSAAAAASARVDDAGDVPETFGYKIEWLAIGTTDHQAVADALEPVDVRPCGWSEGVERAYRDRGALFISPAVGGWTLAVGWMMQGRLSELLPLLEQLSARFGEAQYFGNHRVSDYYAWAKAEDGRIVRAFESGNGEISIDHGPRTAEEESLGLRFTGVEDDSNDLWPGEEHVMLIAGEWSLNPQHLDAYESRGQGPLGRRRRREA
jgi:hypothetical protein